MSQIKQSSNQFKQFSLLDAAVEYTTELRWIASETRQLHISPPPRTRPLMITEELAVLKTHFTKIVREAEDLARHLSAMVEHVLPESEETPDTFLWKLRLAALEQAIESARAATERTM
jgi:hypothetical protein